MSEQLKAVAWLLLSILAAGSMSFYVWEIWSVGQPPQFNDLYAPWWAARELLRHGRNPYSPELAHEIQTVIYGAPAVQPSPEDPKGIGGGFAYPPYAALLLWPTVYMSFSAARVGFLVVAALLLILSLALLLRVAGFRPSFLQSLTIAIFTAGSFPLLQGMKLENLSVIAASLIAATIYLLARGQLVLAGILLAISTFKPQFTVLLVPWLAIWALGEWRGRRRLIWSFLTTMAVLFLISQWLVPGWIRDFTGVLLAYRHYTYGHSLLDVWLSPKWGVPVSILVALAAIGSCWRYFRYSSDSKEFILVTSFLLAITLIIIPTLAPHAQLLLFPGFLCLLRSRKEPQSSPGIARLSSLAAWGLLAWPWSAATALLLAAMWLPITSLQHYWAVPLDVSPVLPLAVSFALASRIMAGSGTGDVS